MLCMRLPASKLALMGVSGVDALLFAPLLPVLSVVLLVRWPLRSVTWLSWQTRLLGRLAWLAGVEGQAARVIKED